MNEGTEETLVSFLDRLASGEPAPGGGAAAALAAATAAALVAMACRVTARYTPSEQIVAASEAAETLRRRLMRLMREDVEAYRAVLETRRAPPSEERAALVQAAMQRATVVPLNTARAAASVLELCALLVDKVRVSTVGDLGVAVALGRAAVDASAVTVRVNLRDVAAGEFVRGVLETLERVAITAGAQQELVRRITARAGVVDGGPGPSS